MYTHVTNYLILTTFFPTKTWYKIMKNKNIAETETILAGAARHMYNIQKNSTKICLHTTIRNFCRSIEASVGCFFHLSEVFIPFSGILLRGWEAWSGETNFA